MLLTPFVYVRLMRRVCRHPPLGDRVMSISPLSHDMRLTAEFVLLEPGLDVGSDELTPFGTVAVFHDRPQLPCDPIAQSIIGCGKVRGRRGGGVVRRGRRPRPEVFVLRERLCDQRRSDRLSIRAAYDASVGLERKEDLAYHPQGQWIDP